jgi:small subunit ribosomal protein S8
MTLNDPLADALSKINNAINSLNKEVILKKSNLLLQILEVMKANDYIGSYEVEEDGKQGLIKVNLLGTINKCGIIKPRFPVKVEEMEKFEKRFLPAKDFGIIIISTNKGLMTQKEVKQNNVGGTLIAYCY